YPTSPFALTPFANRPIITKSEDCFRQAPLRSAGAGAAPGSQTGASTAMKAEHHKESPTHAVRQRVGRLLKEFKARPSTSSVVFGVALLVVAGLAVGWILIRKQEKERSSATWLKYDESTTPEDLETLAKNHPGTTAALAARFEQARLLLRQGLEKYA